MAETIISILVASGALGVAANYIVGIAKWLRQYGLEPIGAFNPRVFAAITSLVLALLQMAVTGDFDVNVVSDYLTIIATGLIGWFVAHLTHRLNKA